MQHIVVIWVKMIQTFRVRAIGKVFLINIKTLIKTHKGDGKKPLFVNKCLFLWSASITLNSNNDDLADLRPFSSLYTLPHISVGLTPESN